MESTVYARPLSIKDLDQCLAVETAAFPPAEAATREKIEYRLSVCPELCYGLFVKNGPNFTLPNSIPVELGESSAKDTLVAHVIATRSNTDRIKDEDMMCPDGWKSNSQSANSVAVGHQPAGKTIALHSLAVSPNFQKGGLGRGLMKLYINQLNGQADRISILTYDRLVPYYQKLGFTHYGKSNSEYAGIAWHDLAYEYLTIGT